MKKRLTLIVLFALFIAIPMVKAQTPAAPPDSSIFKDTTNYTKYEGKVKDYIQWFIKSPINKNIVLRNQIATFLLDWITGSPSVTISFGSAANPMEDYKANQYNADLMGAYLGGMVLYELKNPKDQDYVNIETAGLESVLEMIKNNTALLADNKAAKKFKAMDKDALAKYVKDCVASDEKKK